MVEPATFVPLIAGQNLNSTELALVDVICAENPNRYIPVSANTILVGNVASSEMPPAIAGVSN